ncbi:methyl-accepting chemotaxis protein [Ectobacillus ponti]|uniref:Methyl-accepting chemotaxis protein n=1 Tax=Ectobacillus ponti TaxID=2961894 RepID=A0AA42BNQ1_9BACI|nr:methyl-accepting chemotaxis protein [Ectobacillus ponti]MCP8968230.1 methyl-accepting chemotaxis protein [Ectobacillus ponti]
MRIQWNIKQRLTLLLLLAMAGVLVSLGFILYEIPAITGTYSKLDQERQAQVQLREFNYLVAGLSNDERGYLLTGETEYADNVIKKARDAKEALQRVPKLATEADVKKAATTVEHAFVQYMDTHAEMQAAYEKKDIETAEQLHFNKQRTIRKEVLYPAVDKLTAQIDGAVKKQQSAAAKREQNTVMLQIAVTLAIVLAAAALGILLIRSILRPLTHLQTELQILASGEGDLTKQIDVRSRDEFAALASSFNDFIRTLRSLMQNVGGSSSHVEQSTVVLSQASGEITAESSSIHRYMEQLSEHTRLQQDQAHTSAAALEETTAHLQHIAASSQSVSEAAAEAAGKSENGLSLMDATVKQMGAISGSVAETMAQVRELEQRSQQINDITETIEALASQTNLLALNAAIEAARAGESGRGFAVVADEVKKLAEQSAASAQSISRLIQEIQRDTKRTASSISATQTAVQEGESLTDTTKQTFDEIRAAMRDIHQKIADMSHAITSVNQGAAEASSSVQHIALTAAEAAAAAKEIAASSTEQVNALQQTEETIQSLRRQTEELQEVLGRFRI